MKNEFEIIRRIHSFTWYYQIKSKFNNKKIKRKFNANIYNNSIKIRKDILNIFFYYRLLFKINNDILRKYLENIFIWHFFYFNV